MRLPLSTIGLFAINAVLVGAFADRVLHGSQRDALLMTEAQDEAAVKLKFDLPASADVSAIQARAIFHESRAFHVAAPAPVLEQAPPDYRFAGSMSIPNQPATAVLVHNQTNARTKVASGDQLDGWTIAEIDLRRVLLTLGERTAEITASSRGQVGGMTLASSASPTPATGGGRVRGSGSISARPSSAPQPVSSEAAAPRLYRPPGNQ